MSAGIASLADEQSSTPRKSKSKGEDKDSRKRKRTGEERESGRVDSASKKKQRKETTHANDNIAEDAASLESSHPIHASGQDTAVASTPSRSETTKSLRRHADADQPGQPFAIQTVSLYLPLSPVSQSKPLQGLCAEHLSPNILSYYPLLGGVLLSYSNARLSNAPEEHDGATDTAVYAKTIDEYAVSYAWLTADFVFLKLDRGVWMEGSVTLQNESHLSLLCYNQFNASIERKRLPRAWRWHGATGPDGQKSNEEMDGAFVDGDGNKVDGLMRFKVIDCEGMGATGGNKAEGYMLIEGSLLDKVEEEELVKTEQAKAGAGKSGKMKKNKKPRAEKDLAGSQSFSKEDY